MYGSEGYDDKNSIIEINSLGEKFIGIDGVITQTGDMEVEAYGGHDVWLFKLDEQNNILWQKSYGGEDYDYLQRIISLSNGNLLLFINSKSEPSGNRTAPKIGEHEWGVYDVWIIEVDKDTGEIINEKSIGGDSNNNNLVDCKIRNENEIYVLMHTNDTGSGTGTVTDPPFEPNPAYQQSSDPVLFRLDRDLNVVSQRRLTQGGNGGPGVVSSGVMLRKDVLLLDDEYLYIVVSSSASAGGDKSEDNFSYPNQTLLYADAWIIKMDYDYNVIWDKTYGGNDSERILDAFLTPNKELIVLIQSFSQAGGNKEAEKTNLMSTDFDVWLIKLDENGNKIIDKAYGSKNGVHYHKILPFGEGNYILNGSLGGFPTDSYADITGHHGHWDGMLTQMNEDLDIVSNHLYGGTESDKFFDMVIHENSLYVLGITDHDGSSSPYFPRAVYGGYDLWFLEFSTTLGLTEESFQYQALVYPNPTTGQIYVDVDFATITAISLRSVDGKEITKTTESSLDVSHLPAGIYFVEIQTNKGVKTQKLIKQ